FGVDPVYAMREDGTGSAAEWVRQGVNMALAAVALVVLAPILLVIAALVKLTSRGPVFYTQERVGLDRRGRSLWPTNHRRALDLGGQPFTIYKFRTMSADAEHRTGAVWAAKDDPRVTEIGRFLR